jgi:membrane protease YdiL (CAAX protease family)
MKKYPIASYFVLAYALSWLLWIPAALVVTSAEEPPEWTFFLVILGIYGASGAGFIMTAIMDGKDGVRGLLRRVRIWRVGAQWYLVVFLTVPASLLLGLAIYALQGNPVGPFEPSQLPLLILTAIPAVLFGPLGEEFGWRGFALPRMQLRFSAFWTSIILGVLHTFWHAPLFWAGGGTTVSPDAITVPAVGLFLSWVMIGTFIYTFVLNNAWGSMLLAILFHWSANTASEIIFGLFPALPESAQEQILLATQIPGWIVVLVILAVFGPAHMSRKKPPQKYGLVEAIEPTAES